MKQRSRIGYIDYQKMNTKSEFPHPASYEILTGQDIIDIRREDMESRKNYTFTEDEETGIVDKAKKFDQGKLEHNLFPKEALDAITEVLMFGSKKYGSFNWLHGEGLNWSRVYNACMRHLTAWNDGETLDNESGLNHISHAACNLAFLLTYIRKGIGTDDRYNPSAKE